MFVVILHYVQPMSAVEAHVDAHRAYLERHFAAGRFVASGPQVPRIGGVILADGMSRPELDAVLADDPFYRERIARYEVIEFMPTKRTPGLQADAAASGGR